MNTKFLRVLFKDISKKRKNQLIKLIIITLFSSLLEVFSLGAIFPFVSLFTNPSFFFENEYLRPLFKYFEISEPVEIYFPITLAFFILTSTSYLLKLLLIYLRTNLSRIIVEEISSLIYWRVINEPHQFHSNNNSGDIISSLSHSFYISPKLIIPILKIINSSLILGVALFGMILYRPWITFLILGGISIFYFISARLIVKKLKNYSKIKNENFSKFIRLIQESLGAIKMIILNKTQLIFYKNFKITISKYLKAISIVDFISQLPKMIFEYIIIIIIILLTYNYRDLEKITVLVPLIITIVIAIQKFLPEFNSIYQSFVNIKSNKAINENVINTLGINDKAPSKGNQVHDKIKFKQNIKLKNLSFRYNKNEREIFSNLNLTVQKGEIIGIVGESGSGKSTLIDLLSGIITLNSGQILVDNIQINLNNIQGWRENISIVSQNIFLFDTTIENNITYNSTEEEIDYEKLSQACRVAELTDFIDNQPNGYRSKIGEKGIRISGGQIQRIGIARALYNPSELLILDEATSALDQDTERKVMKNIIDYSQNLTLIIIAHRLTTLKHCDKIFKVEINGLRVFESYAELIKNNKN